MRILIFAPQFAPFANPEAFVNNKLVLAFLEKGWQVDVISRDYAGKVEYDYGSAWLTPWQPLKRITHEISYHTGGILIKVFDTLRCGISVGFIVDGCRWARRALDIAMELHKKNPYQLILSRSAPDSAHLPAIIFSKLTGIPWIANWNDPPMMPNIYGGIKPHRISARHSRFIAAVGREATWHTFPSERMMNYMRRFLGKIGPKSSVIPHCASAPTETIQNKMEVFTICYAGNIFADRYTEAFFKGFKKFITEHKLQNNAVLTIYGKADEGFLNLIDSYELAGTIRFSGTLPYAEMLTVLASNSVLLILESPYVEGIFLPAKMVDYVTTGRPILAVSPIPGTLHDLIEKDGGGIAVDCLSEEDIFFGLCTFYRAWLNGTLDYFYSSSRFYAKFSGVNIISAYQEIFKIIKVNYQV